MQLEVRNQGAQYYSRLAVPGAIGGALLLALLGLALWRGAWQPAELALGTTFTLQSFSAAFLSEYWLHFELTSVLLLTAVVAALAVIKGPLPGRRAQRDGAASEGGDGGAHG
jgi:NADH-quinone oxidoreductase subunit J